MYRLSFFSLVLFLFFFIGCSSTIPPKMVKTGQNPRTFETEIKKTIKGHYLLHLPKDYSNKDKKWPLLLFLHGAGERGDDLELVKTHGPPKIVENQLDFPFVLISPQCPQNDWWTSQNQLDFLSALIEEICSTYHIDRNRIYVTGLSMGGYGTWSLAMLYPQKFAAIAPICGGGDPKEIYKIKDVPVWVFHGAKDTTVPVEKSQEMVDALKNIGGTVKFTIYPEAGHDSWTKTYDDPDLYKWLLSHELVKRK